MAFRGTALESIDIPDSVLRIDEGAFANCKSLTYVKIPKKLDSFSCRTFSSCTSLTTVIVPEKILAMYFAEADDVFYKCPLSPESKKAFEAIIIKD